MTCSVSRPCTAITRIVKWCLILLLLTGAELRGEFASGRDRNVAYIGGLSRHLFVADRVDTTIATEMFFTEVLQRIGVRSIEIRIFDNVAEILQAIRENKLDTIFSNPLDYLELDHAINPDFRYTLTYGSAVEQHIYLLTSTADSIKDISALRGKRLSLPKGYILGRTYLEVYLAKAGLPPPEEFFSSIRSPTSWNDAVLDVFFDKADLTVTTDIAYALAKDLNSQVEDKVDILAVSDPFIPFVIGVNKRVSVDSMNQVDDILTNLKNQPRLRYLLSLYSATNVVKVSSEQIDSLRKLKREHDIFVRHACADTQHPLRQDICDSAQAIMKLE